MSETINYGLYITDSDNERFLDWRTKINGVNDSNMIKIDNALAEKAKHSSHVTVTLYSNLWTGLQAPYTQEVIVDGLTAEQNGHFSVAHESTLDQRDVAREAMLSIVGQSNGKLIIAADGELPDIDIPIVIILLD